MHQGRVIRPHRTGRAFLYDQDFDRDSQHHRGVRRPRAQEDRPGTDRDRARAGLPARGPGGRGFLAVKLPDLRRPSLKRVPLPDLRRPSLATRLVLLAAIWSVVDPGGDRRLPDRAVPRGVGQPLRRWPVRRRQRPLRRIQRHREWGCRRPAADRFARHAGLFRQILGDLRAGAGPAASRWKPLALALGQRTEGAGRRGRGAAGGGGQADLLRQRRPGGRAAARRGHAGAAVRAARRR